MNLSEEKVYTTRADDTLNNLYPQYFQAIQCLKSRIEQLEKIVSLNKEFPYEAQLLALDTITATQQLQLVIKKGDMLTRTTPEYRARMQNLHENRAKRLEAKFAK